MNKITRDIREGAIAGFARHGSNGRGEGGFPGFCFYFAKKHPKAAARIVEKLLPLQVNATGMGSSMIGAVNVVSVPADRYLSAEDVQKLQSPLPLLEHGPQPEQLDAADEDIGPIEVAEAAPAVPEDEIEVEMRPDKEPPPRPVGEVAQVARDAQSANAPPLAEKAVGRVVISARNP